MWPWRRRPHWSTNQMMPKGSKRKRGKKRGVQRRRVNNNAQHNLRILPLKHSNVENTRRVSALYYHEKEKEGAAHLLVILYSLYYPSLAPPLCLSLLILFVSTLCTSICVCLSLAHKDKWLNSCCCQQLQMRTATKQGQKERRERSLCCLSLRNTQGFIAAELLMDVCICCTAPQSTIINCLNRCEATLIYTSILISFL